MTVGEEHRERVAALHPIPRPSPLDRVRAHPNETGFVGAALLVVLGVVLGSTGLGGGLVLFGLMVMLANSAALASDHPALAEARRDALSGGAIGRRAATIAALTDPALVEQRSVVVERDGEHVRLRLVVESATERRVEEETVVDPREPEALVIAHERLVELSDRAEEANRRARDAHLEALARGREAEALVAALPSWAHIAPASTTSS